MLIRVVVAGRLDAQPVVAMPALQLPDFAMRHTGLAASPLCTQGMAAAFDSLPPQR